MDPLFTCVIVESLMMLTLQCVYSSQDVCLQLSLLLRFCSRFFGNKFFILHRFLAGVSTMVLETNKINAAWSLWFRSWFYFFWILDYLSCVSGLLLYSSSLTMLLLYELFFFLMSSLLFQSYQRGGGLMESACIISS